MLKEKDIDNLLLFLEEKFDYFIKLSYDNNFEYTLENLVKGQEQGIFQILATRKQLELANYDKEYSCVIKVAVPVDRLQEYVEHFDIFQTRLHNQQVSIGMPQDIVFEMGSFGRSGDPQICVDSNRKSQLYVTYTLSLNLHLVTSSFLANEIKVYIDGVELLGKFEVIGPSRSAQFLPEMTQSSWQPDMAMMSVGKTLILAFQPVRNCEAREILFKKNTDGYIEPINIRVVVDGLFDYDYYYNITQFTPQGIAGGRISTKVELHKV